MRTKLVLALSLAGLISLNTLANVALIWLMEEHTRGNEWFSQLAIGVLLSQVILAGLWLGLGDGWWLARLLVAIALSILVAKTIGWAMALSPNALRNQQGNEPWAMISFVLMAMMLATSVFASLLRRLRSWRLTWEDVTSVPAAPRFQIVDALLWMIPISGALAAIRFLTSLDDNFPHQLWDLVCFTLSTTAVLLSVMFAAFAPRWHLRGAIMLILAVLFIGVLLFRSYPRPRLPPPQHWSTKCHADRPIHSKWHRETNQKRNFCSRSHARRPDQSPRPPPSRLQAHSPRLSPTSHVITNGETLIPAQPPSLFSALRLCALYVLKAR